MGVSAASLMPGSGGSGGAAPPAGCGSAPDRGRAASSPIRACAGRLEARRGSGGTAGQEPGGPHNPPRPAGAGGAAPLSRVDQLLEALADLEERNTLLGNADGRARLRVATAPGVPPANPEAPESTQLDLLDAGKRRGDAVEDRVHDELGFLLGQVRDLGDLVDEVGLRHRRHSHPPSTGSQPASVKKAEATLSRAKNACQAARFRGDLASAGGPAGQSRR